MTQLIIHDINPKKQTVEYRDIKTKARYIRFIDSFISQNPHTGKTEVEYTSCLYKAVDIDEIENIENPKGDSVFEQLVRVADKEREDEKLLLDGGLTQDNESDF